MDLAGTVCRPAGGVRRADVECAEGKLVFAGGGADVRKIAEPPDHEYDIPFAVDNRTFQCKIDGGIGEAVDEIADVGRIERVGFLLGESGEKRRLSRCVFPDSDDDVTALCIGHRDAVPDEFCPSGAG